MPTHSEVQDYLKALLEYCDFVVEKEHYISPSERIDLYGHSKSLNKTIGIEITFTSDVRKDAERLARFGFDLTYIVVDNPTYEGKIEYHGKVIPIVHYNSIESELRRALNISPTFPRFGAFEEWKIKSPKLGPTFAKGKLDEFRQILKSSGLDEFVKDAENLIGMLYTVKETPSVYRDPVAFDIIRYGGKTNGPQYKAVIEPKILSILRGFGLVHEEVRGSKELRKYFIYLIDKGKELGREIIASRISIHSNELKNFIEEFGKMAIVIGIGTVDRFGGDLLMKLKVGEIVEDKDLTSLLRLYSDRKVREGKNYDEITRKLCSEIDFKDIISKRIDSIRGLHPLISSLCHFLVYCKYNESKKFFEKLEDLGLAFEVPKYGSYGQYFGNEIRAPIEVAEFILNNTKISFDDELLQEFGALMVIYNTGQIKHIQTARERFEDYLRFYEIPIGILKQILDELNKSKLTSKYIELPDSGPFLILDESKFEEIVKGRLIDIALKFLHE